MAPPAELPPSAVVFHFVTGIWAAQALGAAARLKVFDALAGGPKSASEIAAAVGADAGALHRLMRGVAAVGALAPRGEGRYALTPVGDVLRSDVPGSMRSMIIAQTAPGHWLPWGHADEAVRTGKPVAEKVLGVEPWGYFEKNPEEGAHFAEAMTGISHMALGAVMAAASFAGAKTIVDVGGSRGAFLSAALRAEPGARGILFDLPPTIDAARPSVAATDVGSRIELVGGDFFQSVPKGGDTYLLKHILHDWSDAECVKILRNVREAMDPAGRVVVVEMLINEGGPPSPAPLLDLNMLVMLTGRERTADELGRLFAEAGLTLSGVTPTPSPFAIVEARPA